MTATLYLPDRSAPSNLHLRPGTGVRLVSSDLYSICERMKEISPNLFAVELDEGDSMCYAIMEDCKDGVVRLFYKVKKLDGRVLDKLREALAMPAAERIRMLEREEYTMEEERKANELENLYETIGRPMWTQLEKDAFIDRPVSYPKPGVTGGKGSLRRSS